MMRGREIAGTRLIDSNAHQLEAIPSPSEFPRRRTSKGTLAEALKDNQVIL